MWASISDEEWVQRATLIVQGEWMGQTSLAQSGSSSRMELGAIAVQQVLKGPSGVQLVLVNALAAGAPRSSSDLVYRRGDRGLWLLTQRPGFESGPYFADHPQSFVPEGTGAARIEKLRQLISRK